MKLMTATTVGTASRDRLAAALEDVCVSGSSA